MKKQLLAGTALAAAVMFAAGGAVAAEKKMEKKMMKPSIAVGGYHDVNFGAPISEDLENNRTGADFYMDSEIWFKGQAELDSGIKIVVRAELEAQTAGDQMDEYWLSLSGSFGQIILGGTENAASKMVTKYAGSWATGVGENLSFDGPRYVQDVSGLGGGGSQMRLSPGSGDEEKLTYISPSFSGFQIGGSYIPHQGSEDGAPAGNTAASGNSDGFAVAATYGGKFDQVSLGIGGGFLSIPGNLATDTDTEQWIAAAKVGFGPVTVAVAYKRDEGATRDIADGGVRYVQGANSFSLTGTSVTPDDGDASYTAMLASYARALGPGVKTHVDLHWSDSDDGAGMTNTGTGVGVGITVSF